MVTTVAVDPRIDNAALFITPVAPAPLPPRFIVQHTWPCRWQLVDVMASSTAKSVVRDDYTDFESARTERDRLNDEYFVQATR